MVLNCTSIEHFIAASLAVPEGTRANVAHAFNLSATKLAELPNRLRAGTPEAVPAAQAALASMVPLTPGHLTLTPSVVGCLPCVPAAIAGMPQAMYRLEKPPSLGPVRIVVSLSASSTIPNSTLAARGTAITGLVLALQAAGRNVELLTFMEGEGPRDKDPLESYRLGMTVPLDTTPVSVAHVAALLGDAYAYRGFSIPWMINQCGRSDCNLSWPRSRPASGALEDDDDYGAWVRRATGLNAGDIYLPSMYAEHENEYEDAPRWIEEKLSEVARAAETEVAA